MKRSDNIFKCQSSIVHHESGITSKIWVLLSITCIFLFTVPIQAQVVHLLTVDRFTHYRIDDWISYAPALNISSVDIDFDYIYFASLGGGILRFNKYDELWEFPYTTSSGLRSNVINEVVYNPEDGFLYARTPAGIDVYKPAEKFWRPSARSSMPKRRAPSEAELRGLDKKEYRFPPLYRPSNAYLPDFFTDIALTYHLDGKIFDRYNREFRLTDRIIDSWQRLWCGTDGFGPMVADMYAFRLESKTQSIPNISPRDIFMHDDIMWIGGIRSDYSLGGITRWDRKRDEWQYFEAPFISQLYKDDITSISGNEHYIAFGTSLGLVIYNSYKDSWRTLSSKHGLEGDQVLDVEVIGDTAYVGTEFGLNWVDLGSMRVYESSHTTLDHIRINQLSVVDDNVWAATRNGLYSIDIENDVIQFHASQAAAVDYNLTALEIIDNEIWIANDYGIAFWQRDKNEWYSFPDLSFSGRIRDIGRTKNTVWFATDEGLLKFERDKNYWRLYTTTDGLISNNTFHVDPEGKSLWISTDLGITAFKWKRSGRLD
jgi:ligand-binding sensor domain-containing protein